MREIRQLYHARGWHQFDLATHMGVSQSLVSQLLTGRVRGTDDMISRMLQVLEVDLASGQARRLRLAHDLLHAGGRVSEYVASLEAGRWANDECDHRLDKLHRLTADLLAKRAAEGDWRPLLLGEEPRGDAARKLSQRPRADVDADDMTPPPVP